VLSSAAGVRGGQNLPTFLANCCSPKESPRLKLNLANLQAARGHESAAKQTMDLFTRLRESLPKKDKDALTPGLLRRKSQLSRRTSDASDAVRAAESNYSLDTAFVIQGVLAVSNRELPIVERSLDHLYDRGSLMSWLYQAELRFIHGLLLIATRDQNAGMIYSLLCEAQYIYVLLGLQFSITPELPKEVQRSSWGWTPSDVLRFYLGSSGTYKLGRDECLDLRRRAIHDSNLKENIISPMWAS
jgi:hypothetical protein